MTGSHHLWEHPSITVPGPLWDDDTLGQKLLNVEHDSEGAIAATAARLISMLAASS